MQAAWLRRFHADAESNLRAFALRLREAMPESVLVHESRSLFSRATKTTGVTVQIGEHRYVLEVAQGRLRASIATEVRGIVIGTKSVDPADWFARLSAETKQATDHAHALSRSINDFMAS